MMVVNLIVYMTIVNRIIRRLEFPNTFANINTHTQHTISKNFFPNDLQRFERTNIRYT